LAEHPKPRGGLPDFPLRWRLWGLAGALVFATLLVILVKAFPGDDAGQPRETPAPQHRHPAPP
jgi:hypothetical protein